MWTGGTAGRWALSGAWAVLDQGLFALSNFGINIVLARWLAPHDYGVFTITYSIFLVLGTIHMALLAEPMTVYGAGRYRDRLPDYLAILMQGHYLVTAAASVTLAAVALGLSLMGQRALGLSLFALALANPFILELWLLRRICYVRIGPHLAASGGLTYMIILLAGTSLLFRLGWLSSPLAFVLIGFGSMVSALWLRSRLLSGPPARTAAFRREVMAQHWEYGRWAVGTGLLGAVTLNLYYLVMPLWHGLEGAATLKALMNLAMPALQSFLALSVVALPRLVSVRNTAAFDVTVKQLMLICVSAAAVYWLALGLSHSYVVRLLYGGEYARESSLLWGAGMVPIAVAALCVLESALRSLERVDQVFRASVLSSASTCLIGIPLMFLWGPGGAIAGFLVSFGFSVCSMAWSLRTLTAGHGRDA